jgi:uncharacterized damage-inducible protein DinB
MDKEINELKSSVKNIFGQLDDLLQQLSDDDYSRKSEVLLQASIGQHVRHVIELFTELYAGYSSGIINYDKRKRDQQVETNRQLALQLLQDILLQINKANKNLLLQCCFSSSDESSTCLQTNYYRELAYNIEHSIHHMALIRIGVNELHTLPMDDTFGVAAATVKYRNTCVQ